MHYAPAIVGVVLVAMLVAVTLADHKRDAERAYASAKQQYENTKSIAPASPTQRAQSDPKSYRDEWRSEQDLEAQRQMAEWAFLMLIATSVGVIITGVGVVVVALTLTEMREATKHAAAAAESTAEAVRVAQQDSRAWLTIDSIKISWNSVKGGRTNTAIEVMTTNVGRTVATNAFAYALPVFFYDRYELGPLVESVVQLARKGDSINPMIIPPGKTEELRARCEPGEALLPPGDQAEAHGAFFVALVVIYQTAGGQAAITTAAFGDPSAVLDRASAKLRFLTLQRTGFVTNRME